MSLSISIAMTTYNGARFVAEQLESFAKQTLLPTEVIVVDDGSSDGSRDIVSGFAAKVPFPVRLTTFENYLGYKKKFQIAAELCQSDIIFFSDQDDVWLPHKLAACLETFANKDVLLAYHNATVTDGTLNPIGSMAYQGAPQAINPAGSLRPWLFGNGFTLVFRRELLAFSKHWPQSVDFYHPEEREAHDQWFFFLASCLGSIAYIKEPLALYRQHGGNMFGAAKQSQNVFLSHLYNLMSTNIGGLRNREISAIRRGVILEAMQNELTDFTLRQRAGVAAAGYGKLAAGYRLRHDMYISRNTFSKLSQLYALIGQGTYRPRQEWGVGWQAIVRDILRGVIIPVRQPPDTAASSTG